LPVYANFTLARYEDGILTVSMTPPTPIGGWTLQFSVCTRFGGTSPLVTKSCASGYNGTSGITITNSGQGFFAVQLKSADTSGLDPGNFAYVIERLDSGARSLIVQRNEQS
jgi:hypothetical protein